MALPETLQRELADTRAAELRMTRELERAQHDYEMSLEDDAYPDEARHVLGLIDYGSHDEDEQEEQEPQELAWVKQSTPFLRARWPLEWPTLVSVARTGVWTYRGSQEAGRAAGRVFDKIHQDLLERLGACPAGDPSAVYRLAPDVRVFKWFVTLHAGAIAEFQEDGLPPDFRPWLRTNLFKRPEFQHWDRLRLRLLRQGNAYRAAQKAYDQARGKTRGRKEQKRLAEARRRVRLKAGILPP